ncbi:hypothetical protein [Paenibacillus plantiphilus]|uniref:hypothetical protein n=1 Tax=Paenibacillus plantiphilus TaxID=2905650 RepID=UPI001F26629C|nr:hypothetical protein [Paenibacillus plantiphilus]
MLSPIYKVMEKLERSSFFIYVLIHPNLPGELRRIAPIRFACLGVTEGNLWSKWDLMLQTLF